MTLVSMTGAEVRFGARTLLENVTFQVGEGERWGIVGRNGSGKTTLLNLVIGRLEPDEGVVVRKSGLRIAMMDQHREFAGAGTVWQAAPGAFAPPLAPEQSLADPAGGRGAGGGDAPPARPGRGRRAPAPAQRGGGCQDAA